MKVKKGIKEKIADHSFEPADVTGMPNLSESNFVDLKRREFEYKLDGLKDDNLARKKFGGNIFHFTLVWLIMVLVIFFGVGLEKLHYSDAVLIAFLTTTTATAVGFLIIVFNYLFKGK